MVSMDIKKSSYALYRFNPSRLFYPKGGSGGRPRPDRAAAAVEACSLPPPAMSFHPIQFKHKLGSMDLMLFGKDRNKVVCTDQTGRAVLYDDGLQAVRMLPNLKVSKWQSVPLPVGDSLFVMEAVPMNDQEKKHQSLEALMYGGSRPGLFNGEDFFWHPIPPPPYVYAPGYGGNTAGIITARTVVGGSGVWISAASFGTYCYDTVSGKWSKAGDWRLPFNGPAEYVPEYNLWFGISDREEDGVLCASDLGAASETQRPAVQEWEGFAAPEGVELESYLLHLGAARFCVAKLYKTTWHQTGGQSCCRVHDTDTTVNLFVMFTGVEIQRRGKTGRELQIVKHKSCSYSMGAAYVPQILY